MMSTRFNPKPQRRLYTVHLKDKYRPLVFHICNTTNEPYKSTLVCVQNVSMAEQLIECIRGYYAFHQTWPDTEISLEKPLQILNPDEDKMLSPSQWATVPKLWIVSWKEKELDTYAMNHLFDLLEIKEDGKSVLYTFKYELGDLKTYFEKRLEAT
jgi:hypothetical protein